MCSDGDRHKPGFSESLHDVEALFWADQNLRQSETILYVEKYFKIFLTPLKEFMV